MTTRANAGGPAVAAGQRFLVSGSRQRGQQRRRTSRGPHTVRDPHHLAHSLNDRKASACSPLTGEAVTMVERAKLSHMMRLTPLVIVLFVSACGGSALSPEES